MLDALCKLTGSSWAAYGGGASGARKLRSTLGAEDLAGFNQK